MHKHFKGKVTMLTKKIVEPSMSSLLYDWWIFIHSKQCVLGYTMCGRHCTRHTPWHLLPKAGIYWGTGSFLICFITQQDSHYVTSLLNLNSSGRSNMARHRSGYPAPGVLRTLWTLNSSPSSGGIMHLLNNLHNQGKLGGLFLSSLYKQHISHELTWSFINESKKHSHVT